MHTTACTRLGSQDPVQLLACMFPDSLFECVSVLGGLLAFLPLWRHHMKAPGHVRAKDTVIHHFLRTALWRRQKEVHCSQRVANDRGKIFPPYIHYVIAELK